MPALVRTTAVLQNIWGCVGRYKAFAEVPVCAETPICIGTGVDLIVRFAICRKYHVARQTCQTCQTCVRGQMGCRLGRQAKTLLFRHNDVVHLDSILRDLRMPRDKEAATQNASLLPNGNNIFVTVESVYSMDGDLAPLAEILRIAEKYGAMVIVDEAHG